MKGLIQKILGIEDKPSFTADEIKPLFQSLGINIETIGFPSIDHRNDLSGLSRYKTKFEEVKITPAKIDGAISTIITGKYETQAVINHIDKEGSNYPGAPCLYLFKIQEGKLINLQRRN